MSAHELGFENAALALGFEGRALARRNRQHDANAARPFYNVRVRHHVTAGIDDHAGTDRSLPRDESGLGSGIVFQWAVTGYQDLHDALRHLVGKADQRIVELNERLGRWHFWLMFVFFNLTFFPMHLIGTQGMPRRVSDYLPEFANWNLFISIASFGLGASTSYMTAIDYKTGKVVWRHEISGGAGLLSTAGGLLFSGDGQNLVGPEARVEGPRDMVAIHDVVQEAPLLVPEALREGRCGRPRGYPSPR